MLLHHELEQMMNRQYTNEYTSALMYKNIAGFYDDKYLPGIGKFFQKKFQEELEHAQKFYEYVNSRDGRAKILEISAESLSFDEKDIIQPFYHALQAEQKVSKWIHELFSKARSLNDYASEEFLHFFIKEQIEEESEFLDLISRLELVKGSGNGLIKFNDYLEQKGSEALIKGI